MVPHIYFYSFCVHIVILSHVWLFCITLYTCHHPVCIGYCYWVSFAISGSYIGIKVSKLDVSNMVLFANVAFSFLFLFFELCTLRFKSSWPPAFNVSYLFIYYGNCSFIYFFYSNMLFWNIFSQYYLSLFVFFLFLKVKLTHWNIHHKFPAGLNPLLLSLLCQMYIILNFELLVLGANNQ